MSFVLPGNARQLRFTGEAKALRDEMASGTPGAGIALGKPRVRKPTTPPPAVPSRPPRNTGATPASPGGGSYTPAPSIRAKGLDRHDSTGGGWDNDDQQSTMAFDREGRDVLPGQRSTRPPPAPSGGPPIPGFRPAHAAAQAVVIPNQATGSTELRPKGAPLALWIFAAILAGILSYHVTPAVMTHFEAPPPKAG